MSALQHVPLYVVDGQVRNHVLPRAPKLEQARLLIARVAELAGGGKVAQ